MALNCHCGIQAVAHCEEFTDQPVCKQHQDRYLQKCGCAKHQAEREASEAYYRSLLTDPDALWNKWRGQREFTEVWTAQIKAYWGKPKPAKISKAAFTGKKASLLSSTSSDHGRGGVSVLNTYVTEDRLIVGSHLWFDQGRAYVIPNSWLSDCRPQKLALVPLRDADIGTMAFALVEEFEREVASEKRRQRIAEREARQ